MKKLKVGILGSSGFVGKALTNKLIGNSNISELHLYTRKFPLKENNFSVIKVHQFELSKENQYIPESLYNIDVLYYLISDCIPATSWDNAGNELKNNLLPFIGLIEKIQIGKLKKIVFTSSAGTIYGPSNKQIDEQSVKIPYSPYGIVKLTTEYYLDFFKLKYNVAYEIYRISNIYGPDQNTKKGLGLINTLIENYISNKKTTIYGDGSILRNYIFIEDVVNILSQTINNDLNDSFTLNLASEDNLIINDVISIIEQVVNDKLTIKYTNHRKSDNPNIALSNKKLKEKYKDIHLTSLKIGIKKTLNSFLSH